jgi:hypothetical protein
MPLTGISANLIIDSMLVIPGLTRNPFIFKILTILDAGSSPA